VTEKIEKENILGEVFDLLSEKYTPGLYEYSYKYYPEYYKKFIILEDRIDENFQDNGNIQELKTILREYWCLHMKCIKEFLKADSICDNPEIRNEMIEEREWVHSE